MQDILLRLLAKETKQQLQKIYKKRATISYHHNHDDSPHRLHVQIKSNKDLKIVIVKLNKYYLQIQNKIYQSTNYYVVAQHELTISDPNQIEKIITEYHNKTKI